MLIFDAYNEAKFATHRHHTIHGICLISKFPRLQNIGPLIFEFIMKPNSPCCYSKYIYIIKSLIFLNFEILQTVVEYGNFDI